MRLVCPNCDAEYEVDDTAIPRSGRDVQCSSCGHGWFQEHPEVKAEAEEEIALFGDMRPEPAEPPPVRAPRVSHAAPPLPEAVPTESGPVSPVSSDLAPVRPISPPPSDPPRRSIDESVLAVLREEAEREAAARRGDRPALETQTEMTLTEAPRSAPATPPTVAPDPVADLPVAEVPVAPVAPRKRELLPAIEEIKSSLNPVSDLADAQGAGGRGQGDGAFRSGFIFVMLILVILLAIYVLAPAIAARVPALEGALARYVQIVNDLRLALDGQLQGIIGRLQTLMGGTVS